MRSETEHRTPLRNYDAIVLGRFLGLLFLAGLGVASFEVSHTIFSSRYEHADSRYDKARVPLLEDVQEQEIILLYQHNIELTDQLLRCKGIDP